MQALLSSCCRHPEQGTRPRCTAGQQAAVHSRARSLEVSCAEATTGSDAGSCAGRPCQTCIAGTERRLLRLWACVAALWLLTCRSRPPEEILRSGGKLGRPAAPGIMCSSCQLHPAAPAAHLCGCMCCGRRRRHQSARGGSQGTCASSCRCGAAAGCCGPLPGPACCPGGPGMLPPSGQGSAAGRGRA
jgi:hypothetical protein